MSSAQAGWRALVVRQAVAGVSFVAVVLAVTALRVRPGLLLLHQHSVRRPSGDALLLATVRWAERPHAARPAACIRCALFVQGIVLGQMQAWHLIGEELVHLAVCY